MLKNLQNNILVDFSEWVCFEEKNKLNTSRTINGSSIFETSHWNGFFHLNLPCALSFACFFLFFFMGICDSEDHCSSLDKEQMLP